MTQEVCWPLHKYRKGQYSSAHNARCHCSQNSTASVASYLALTFFLKKVRFSITRRTGLVLEIRLFLLTVIFVEKISNELITS